MKSKIKSAFFGRLHWIFHAADKKIAPPQIREYRKDQDHDTTKIRLADNAFYIAYPEIHEEYPITQDLLTFRKKVLEQQWHKNVKKHLTRIKA